MNPSYATAHQRYALFLTGMGRLDDALGSIQRAHQLDPLSFIINTDLGLFSYISRKYEEAIEQFQSVLEMAPEFGVAHFALGLAYEQKGHYEESIAEFREAITLSGRLSVMKGALGHACAVSGRQDEARAVMKKLLDPLREDYVSPYTMATIHLGLGEREEAIRYFSRAFDERSLWLIHLHLSVDPRIDCLRGDPVFDALLRRITPRS